MRYQKIAQYNLKHAYFGEGTTEIFRVQPTVACIEMMEKYRFLFRATLNGFFIGAPVVPEEGSPKGLAVRVPSNLRLSFVVKSLDTYLWNFSNFPINLPLSPVYYYDALTTCQENQSLEADHWLTTRQKKFTLGLPPDSTPCIASIHSWGEALPIKTWKIAAGVPQITIDMQEANEGAYQLKANGELLEQVYLSNSLVSEKPFAIIEWALNPSSNSPTLTSTFNLTECILTIPNRATLWRYFVVEKYNEISEDATLEILCNQAGYEFQKQASMSEEGVHVFVSQQEILLKQEGIQGIELLLKNNQEAQEKTLISNLPNPGRQSVVIECNQVFAEQYIYI